MKKITILLLILMTVTVEATEWNACLRYWYYHEVSTVEIRSTELALWDDSGMFEWAYQPHPTTNYIASFEAVAVPWLQNHNYSIKQTPEWTNMVAVLDAISPLLDVVNADIDAETDAAVKKKLKHQRDVMKAMLNWIKATKKLIGKNMDVEP